MKQTEDYLAAELNKLTTQERGKAMDDIHCVGEELRETPEMVERLLKEFEQMVVRMQTPVYAMAVDQNRDYVENSSFRLRFLRCNMHNVQESVRQMMEFLQHKAAYFGEDKVAREITLDDLTVEDTELLLSGLFHIQEETDRNGRVVLYVMGEEIGRCQIENLIHVAYYIFNVILTPRQDAQMKGDMELQYKLRSLGVPEQSFPVAADGNIRRGILNAWFNKHTEELESKKQPGSVLTAHASINQPVRVSSLARKPRESAGAAAAAAAARRSASPDTKLINPSEQHVLLGRGWKVQNHEGNKAFRSFLEGYSDEYDNAPRLRKRQIAGELVHMLRGRGVRFLQQRENGQWIDSTFEDAQKKVGQLFRTLRKSHKH
ncbi:MAG: hypothetical protein SGBAC_007288 [Bacillariaceae sp.]